MPKILPPRIEPPRTPFGRIHRPSAGRYETYRQCLRWEFGFVCPFCLVHEADIVHRGAEGFGVMTVEHRALQSEEPASRDDYENCLLCCRLCNRSRGLKRLRNVDGCELLDPTQTPWSHHFCLEQDMLIAQPGDANAEYTVEAYQPNTPRKVDMRRIRREKLEAALQQLDDYEGRVAALVAVVQHLEAPADVALIFSAINDLRTDRKRLLSDLAREWPIKPTDAPNTCRCDGPGPSLPDWLVCAAIDIPPE